MNSETIYPTEFESILSLSELAARLDVSVQTMYDLRSQGRGYIATARYRDADGRLRPVTGSGQSRSAAQARLKQRLLNRAGYGSRGVLALTSSFRELVALWLADLE